MKRGLIVLIIIILSSIAYGQEISETVTNRLSIEFHAVTGTDEVAIDLPRYFGRDADFVYKASEHVAVDIDPATHIATLRPIDPEWRGIETVVFATGVIYLDEKSREGGILLPRNVTKARINVSKEDIAMDTDAFTQVQFETVLGNLTSEPVDISAMISNASFLVAINDEMYFNMSFDEKMPKMNMLWKLRTSTNMSSARYKEASDVLTFSIIMFILLSAAVVILYVYYGYAESIREKLFLPRRVTKRLIEKDITLQKRKAMGSLTAIQNKAGKDKPGKLYKEGIAVMNRFLAESYGIKGGSADKANEKLARVGLPPGVLAKLSIYLSEHKARVYSGADITDDELLNFISFLKSIVSKL